MPVVATGDVHFMDPKDAIYRAILMAAKGFEDADQQPPLYFRTTDEMLEEFAYLGRGEGRCEVVVDNPNRIADQVEEVQHLHQAPRGQGDLPALLARGGELHPHRIALGRAPRALRRSRCPRSCRSGWTRSWASIIGYGFSTLYMIAVKLVAKSLADGYIVGSRGSVGSSFVAHHVRHHRGQLAAAPLRLPQVQAQSSSTCRSSTACRPRPAARKNCPECGTRMMKDGFNIPFEVFLGFKGDKVPDIDLNFSGVYQPVAHNYIKELFGADNVFRAGTIGTVAEKTAYGYVLKYLEERGIERLQRREGAPGAPAAPGVKRTTGQHPARHGRACPRTTKSTSSPPSSTRRTTMTTETVTTHFDFNSMHDVLVKLDILGHDDPTMLRHAAGPDRHRAAEGAPGRSGGVQKHHLAVLQPRGAGRDARSRSACPTGTLRHARVRHPLRARHAGGDQAHAPWRS